jgi:hypothetical protein
MAVHRGPDEPRAFLSGNSTGAAIRMGTETAAQAPDTLVASYDLDKVMAAARGWQEKAAAAPDPASSEAYRRSAAQFERLVMRSLDTPPIC